MSKRNPNETPEEAEIRKAKRREYYARNKERICANSKRWYEQNKDRVNDGMRKYYKEHKEEIDERKRKWSNEHAEELETKRKKRYQENRERICERAMEYHWRNREKILPRQRRTFLLRKYKLTIEQFQGMMDSQKGRCKCCNTAFGLLPGQRPAVDHCHKTGAIRGLLCTQCNILLGYAYDSPEILRKCARYLTKTLKEHPPETGDLKKDA